MTQWNPRCFRSPVLVWLLLASTMGAAPGPAAAQIRINYQDAELMTVVTALAEIAGLNVVFVGTEDPTARVTLKMGQPVAPEAVPGLLRTILESAGYVAVERDGLLQVLPAGEARTRGETQVFVHPLRHATAPEMAVTLAALYGNPEAAAAAAGTGVGRRSLSDQLRNQGNLGNFGGGMATFPGGVGLPGGTTGMGLGMGRGTLEPRADAQVAVGGVAVGDAVVVPYTPTNSLIIRTTPRNYELLRETIDRLDAQPRQVLIEVFVAEVTLDDRTEFGIDWSATFRDAGAVQTADRFQTFGDSTPGGLVVRMLRLGSDVDVRATLRALAERSRVNVLATPSVLARNNEEARILVGSQVPFTQIARSGLSGEVLDRVIQFRDVGTELAIVPTINEGGYVTLDVLQQVSTLTNQTLFGAPVITVREAQTSAVVQDRQTIVIGGLIDSEQARIRRGIPLLKDLPLLGWLFSDTEIRGRKTELVIFLTPYVVSSDAEVDQLRESSLDRLRRGEQLRREMDRQRLLPRREIPVAPADTTSLPNVIRIPRSGVPADTFVVFDTASARRPAVRDTAAPVRVLHPDSAAPPVAASRDSRQPRYSSSRAQRGISGLEIPRSPGLPRDNGMGVLRGARVRTAEVAATIAQGSPARDGAGRTSIRASGVDAGRLRPPVAGLAPTPLR